MVTIPDGCILINLEDQCSNLCFLLAHSFWVISVHPSRKGKRALTVKWEPKIEQLLTAQEADQEWACPWWPTSQQLSHFQGCTAFTIGHKLETKHSTYNPLVNISESSHNNACRRNRLKAIYKNVSVSLFLRPPAESWSWLLPGGHWRKACWKKRTESDLEGILERALCKGLGLYRLAHC